jgi:hypothetical protein
MLFVRFAHFLGFVLFAAAAFGAWTANRAAQGESGDGGLALDRVQRTFARVASWGAGLVVLSGLGAVRVFHHDGPGMMKETWLLVMMVAGVAAAAVAGAAGARTRKLLAAATDADRRALRDGLATLHGVVMALSIVAVACGIFRF